MMEPRVRFPGRRLARDPAGQSGSPPDSARTVMLKPALQLRLGQQLTMTPQLQQAIRLLQLPIVELESEIQQALEAT